MVTSVNQGVYGLLYKGYSGMSLADYETTLRTVLGSPRRKAIHLIECIYNQADTQMDSLKEILTGLLDTVGLFTNRNASSC